MLQNRKKYVIKESELKEIIKEMIILEVATSAGYDPNSPDDMHTSKYTGPMSDFRVIDRIEALVKKSGKTLKNYIAGSNNNFLKTLFGVNDDGTENGNYQGPNFGAKETLNVRNACLEIRRNAYPRYDSKTCGNCARAVRKALYAGGLKGMGYWRDKNGHMLGPYGMYAPSAKYYINVLPANGWGTLHPSQAGQPGDVCVIDECIVVTPQGKRSQHKDGHISMCIGNGVWVSDYVQGTWHGLDGTPPPSKVHFFRYSNIV